MFKKLRQQWRAKTGYWRLTEGRNLSEITHSILKKQLALLVSQPPTRADPYTRELTPHQFHIESDYYGEPDATTILPRRGNNPFATIAETLWVFAGRSDAVSLTKWLPGALEYSDDGKTWSSSYGQRLRAWKASLGNVAIDQIQVVYSRLKKDPNTKKAVIVLWDPAHDGIKEFSKDYASNISVQFLIQEGTLNVHVSTRSSDIIYGIALNVFQWCFLGHYLAEQLGIPFQHYYHTSSSLYLYGHVLAEHITYLPFLPSPRLNNYRPGNVIKCAPDLMRKICDAIYSAAINGTITTTMFDLNTFPSRLRDFAWALAAETKLSVSGQAYLEALSNIRYAPLLLSLLDIGMRRRKECLWLCKGFDQLWTDTFNEILAARYLKRLYELNEGHYVLKGGDRGNQVWGSHGGNSLQSR